MNSIDYDPSLTKRKGKTNEIAARYYFVKQLIIFSFLFLTTFFYVDYHQNVMRQ